LAATTDAASIICGQEGAKRATLVAAAGGHTLLLVGSSGCGKTMLRAVALQLGLATTFEARLCKCGAYGDPRRSCPCTPRQLASIRNTWPECEITVEVPPVPAKYKQASMAGTSTEEMKKQIEDAATYASLVLHEDARRLLDVSQSETGFDDRVRETIIRVARTIANLDHSENIELSHLTEAINYRPLSALWYG
jgi:predicted ATPase with chaperone activity